MSETLAVTVGGIIPIQINNIEKVELLELLGVGGFGSSWLILESKRLLERPPLRSQNHTGNLGSSMVERIYREATVVIPSEYIISAIDLPQWDERTFLILFD